MRGPGFTFIQILLVLALIAVVAIILVIIIKPSKILEKSRDSQRFTDVKMLSEAINRYLAEGHNFQGLVGPYSSIDPGFSNDTLRQKIDGSGWLPINFEVMTSGAPLQELPLDPLNNITHNYRFGASTINKTYEINCVFESPENIPKLSTDGGNDADIFEIGTDLTIL